MDDVVDKNLLNDLDSESIFGEVIVHKISNGSSQYLYTRCRMNLTSDIIQTHIPQFMDLVFSAINTLDEISGISNPDTRIRRPADGAHWSILNHVFSESTVVGVSDAKSYNDYNCKTEYEIWK